MSTTVDHSPAHSSKFQIPHEEHAEDERHKASIYALQIRGNRMVTASADKTVRRWDLDTGRLIPSVIDGRDLTSFTGSVICLQFDDRPEDDIIIAGAVGGTVAVICFSTGLARKALRNAHSDTVLSLHFDDKFLVTSSKDEKVKVWNRLTIHDVGSLPTWLRPSDAEDQGDILEEYTLLGTLSRHHGAVNAIQISGNTIISGGSDQKVLITDLQTGQIVHSFALGCGVADLHFNSRLLLIGCTNNTTTICDTSSMSVSAKLKGHRNLIRAVDAVSDGEAGFVRIATGGYDGLVRIWEQNAAIHTGSSDHSEGDEPWAVKATFEYGLQPELISDDNPYVHRYEEGQRVFDVSLQDDKIFCSGQGNVVVGWKIPGSF